LDLRSKQFSFPPDCPCEQASRIADKINERWPDEKENAKQHNPSFSVRSAAFL
jgi:hypothetical protein